MKGGKDEKKLMDPLFPRLHINDAEKGGPRAPPRNKMALYEQLSIPSQRFSSGSASTLPLAPNNSGSLVPSTSSSHVGSHKRNVFSTFCNSPPSPHLPKRLHSYSSSGVNLNTTSKNFEWLPIKPTNCETLNVREHLSTTANCSLFQPHSFSKNSSVKKLGDENDFRVPTFAQSGRIPTSGNGQQDMDKEKFTTSSQNSSRKLQTDSEKQLKQAGTTDLWSRQHLKNKTEENPRVSHTSQNCAKKPASILSNGNIISADASSGPLTIDRISEPVKRTHISLNQEKRSSLVHDLGGLHDFNEQLDQECRALQKNQALKDGVSVESERDIGKRNASTLEGASYSRPSFGDNNGSPNRCDNTCEHHEDRECMSLQVGDVDGNDDVSDTSMVDSISGLNISADDVVGVIGLEHFWKARRAIVHQQRVFAVQVFELHRLIKVQRLIAGSPDLLLEDNLYQGKPPIKVSPVKKLPSEFVLEPLTLIVKPNDDFPEPNPSIECAAENAVGKPPLSSFENDTNKGPVTQQSSYKPYSGNPSPASTATDKPSPWWFHPQPGNQWLVPVMSPSEGLVYKPYAGPCPPTSGFMAPVYGSCRPMSLTPVGGDFFSTAYGVPPSHQLGIGIIPSTPLVQTYFPPYGMPLTNPSVSSSAVEQVTPFARAQLSNGQDNQLPTRGVNLTIPYQSSCNMSTQNSGLIPFCVRNFQASKESELQGSTASSPSERVQRDALLLFPTAPTVQALDQPAQTRSSEQRTQVIKVVPQNPRSASESAARIFQSIQKERKQYVD
uniref:Putative Hydroxyproline-rich glycoprotein family protein n=1 Tax=Davidia involucrata TaxID=16924 RepID=A0A5B7BD38_DAVIN